jgi:hypothetical protein
VREIHGLPGLVLLPDVQSLPSAAGGAADAGGGISDEEWLARLGVFYHEAQVAEMVRKMEEAGMVRAGMVEDPADCRWSSCGEAIGGRVKGCRLTRLGYQGDGKKAREGLVRAYYCDQGVGFEAGKWAEVARLYRRMMGMALGKKAGHAEFSPDGLDSCSPSFPEFRRGNRPPSQLFPSWARRCNTGSGRMALEEPKMHNRSRMDKMVDPLRVRREMDPLTSGFRFLQG